MLGFCGGKREKAGKPHAQLVIKSLPYTYELAALNFIRATVKNRLLLCRGEERERSRKKPTERSERAAEKRKRTQFESYPERQTRSFKKQRSEKNKGTKIAI